MASQHVSLWGVQGSQTTEGGLCLADGANKLRRNAVEKPKLGLAKTSPAMRMKCCICIPIRSVLDMRASVIKEKALFLCFGDQFFVEL